MKEKVKAMNPELSKEDIHNLLALLRRTPVTGSDEAFVLVAITQKLQALSDPPTAENKETRE